MENKNVYYIGSRLSDITITFDANKKDSFFKGSITCYGDGKDGNIAYNVLSGIQLCDNDAKYGARNDAIYSKFFATQCRKVVEQDADALFLPYSAYFARKIPSEFADRIICCNSIRILDFLNSKINFKKLIDGKIPQPAFKLTSGTKVLAAIESGEIPNTKEVVIQAEYSAGGEGTFFATRKCFSNPEYVASIKEKIDPEETYIITDYIENICSVGVHFQVSNNEVAMYPPGVQLLNGPTFVGGDLYKYSQLDDDIKKECEDVVQKFGQILQNIHNEKFRGIGLKKARLRGYFGLDVIVAKSGSPRVFAIETNARFTGQVGLLNILCNMAGIGSVYEHAYQAFYNETTDLTKKFKEIKPNGRKKYAKVEVDEDGLVVNEKYIHRNQEGLDETAYQEEGFYTHAIFEKVRGYNTLRHSPIVSKKKKRKKRPLKQKEN